MPTYHWPPRLQRRNARDTAFNGMPLAAHADRADKRADGLGRDRVMSYDVEHGEPFWEEFGEGRSDARTSAARRQPANGGRMIEVKWRGISGGMRCDGAVLKGEICRYSPRGGLRERPGRCRRAG